METLVRIDAQMAGIHSALSSTDECYFLWEYTAYGGYDYSIGNELIKNIKKPIDRKGMPEWKWKEFAIREIAAQLAAALPAVIDFTATTLIPIPPSKCRANPLYDDRLLRILRLACPPDADIRELIVNKADLQPAHKSGEDYRPSVQTILDNYTWQDEQNSYPAAPLQPAAPAAPIDPAGPADPTDSAPAYAADPTDPIPADPANPIDPTPAGPANPSQPIPPHNTLVLFDDVLTGGNHFVASKRFLHQRYPNHNIIGIFICRRISEEVFI